MTQREPASPRTYRHADPMVWGAVTAIAAALLVAITTVTGTQTGGLETYTPTMAAGGGFAWGAATAWVRNKLNEKRR